AARGLEPHGDGAPTLDRPGAAPDPQRELAERRNGVARSEPRRLHQPLSRTGRRRLRPDAPLRAAGPTHAEGGAPARGGAVLVNLEIFWFCLIAVLWGGYFVLEGFDFGVGMLLPFVPRDERERGVMFESIGPV